MELPSATLKEDRLCCSPAQSYTKLSPTVRQSLSSHIYTQKYVYTHFLSIFHRLVFPGDTGGSTSVVDQYRSFAEGCSALLLHGSDTPQTGPRPTPDAGSVGGAPIGTAGDISGDGCVADANGCTDAMVMVSAGPPYQVWHTPVELLLNLVLQHVGSALLLAFVSRRSRLAPTLVANVSAQSYFTARQWKAAPLIVELRCFKL